MHGVISIQYRSLVFVFLIVFLAGVASAQDTGLADTGFYEDTGIESDQIEGCDTGCTYENGVLTMQPGASLDLTSIPDDVVIEVNGGEVRLPDGDVISSGTFDTNTMTLTAGEISLDPLSDLDMRFESSGVTPTTGVEIMGTGIIENGQVKLIEEAYVHLKGSDDVIQVWNLEDPVYAESAYIEGNLRDFEGHIALGGVVNPNTRIGNDQGYVTMEDTYLYGSVNFYYDNGALVCSQSCNYDINGNPSFILATSTVVYEPSFTRKQLEEDPNIARYKATQTVERTISVNGGEKHVVEGLVYTAEDSIIFHPDLAVAFDTRGDPVWSPALSVDGVYVGIVSSPVQVFLEHGDNTVPAGNHIVLEDDYYQIGGTDFAVGMGDVGGGNPNNWFPFTFTEQNPYYDQDRDDASFRLFFGMNGGLVSGDSETIDVNTPGVYIANGVNGIVYQEGEDFSIEYDYSYIPCDQTPAADFSHASCGEYDVDIVDGGRVNVVTEEGTVQDESRSMYVEIQSTGLTEEKKGFEVEGATHRYQLDTGKVYLMGYRGGAAAAGLAGEENEYDEWGHVGMAYYKDGQWWVAEEDGGSAVIVPLDESLFSSKLNGVWEVKLNDPQAMIEAAEGAAGSDYIVYNEDHLFGREDNGYTCSGFCTMAMQSAGADLSRKSVSFSDWEESGRDVSISTQVFQALAAEVEPTPRWLLIDNPYLVRQHDLYGAEEPVITYFDPDDKEKDDNKN